MYKVGSIVEHILSKDWLLVLDYDNVNNKYFCRMKNNQTDWFFEFELIDRKTNIKEY
jgi:hypothetical protein